MFSLKFRFKLIFIRTWMIILKYFKLFCILKYFVFIKFVI